MVEIQVSHHEVKIYDAVRRHGSWLTAKEAANLANVADRTARHHAAALAKVGILDIAKVFGGFRYRMKDKHDPVASRHISKIEEAKEAF